MFNFSKKSDLGNIVTVCVVVLCFLPLNILFISCSNSSNKTQLSDKPSGSAPAPTVSSEISKKLLLGVWGTSPSENASFRITADSIHYPDANMTLQYFLNGTSFVCLDGKGDTNYSCKILKLTGDSLVMKDQNTDEISAFIHR